MPAALLRIEDAAHAPLRTPLVVGGQHLRLELGGVGVGRWVLAAAFLAVAAEVFLSVIFLLAVWRFAIALQVDAAAVAARACFSDHDDSTHGTQRKLSKLGHCRRLISPSSL